jgi:hypothetical protein
MDHEHLHRFIDTAAERMVRREPPRSLASAVMSRVMNGQTEPHRRVVVGFGLSRTGTAAAAAVGFAALMIVMLNRAPQPTTNVGSPKQSAVAQVPAGTIVSGRAPQEPAAVEPRASARRREVARTVRPSPLLAPVVSDAPVEGTAIVFESITLAAIDVPLLEVSAASVNEIAIEPLVVEPLTASND